MCTIIVLGGFLSVVLSCPFTLAKYTGSILAQMPSFLLLQIYRFCHSCVVFITVLNSVAFSVGLSCTDLCRNVEEIFVN